MAKIEKRFLALRNEPTMENFYTYFNPIINAYSQLVSKFGKDAVWKNIEYAGGERDFGGKSRSRVVSVPADTEKIEESSTIMIFSTSPKSVSFHCPHLYKKSGNCAVSIGLSSIPEEKKEEYRETLLRNLEKLEQKLSHD